jgi:hypothetical protein
MSTWWSKATGALTHNAASWLGWHWEHNDLRQEHNNWWLAVNFSLVTTTISPFGPFIMKISIHLWELVKVKCTLFRKLGLNKFQILHYALDKML